MIISSKDFPKYSESHYKELMRYETPVEELNGYIIKRDDLFQVGNIRGGKVRQCMRVVYENLDDIKKNYNGGLITGGGLPSPMSSIVSSVAKYFGLKCVVTSPMYDNSKIDYNRINVSLAQKLGATIYGVGNYNPTGFNRDIKELNKVYDYYEIKFGMQSDYVIDTTSYQAKNIPNDLENLICVCGSGLNLLGILKGIVRYKKKIKNVYGISLSHHFNNNKKLFYDTLPRNEKYDGELHIIRSPYSYQKILKSEIDFIDWTYENKSFVWMQENIKPSTKTLFWNIGIRNYDLDNIEPIKWNKSNHEKELDIIRRQKKLNGTIKRTNLHEMKTNITYEEIQQFTFPQLSCFIDELRDEIKEIWKKNNTPPIIGKNKDDIIKSFNRLKSFPTESMFFTDKNYPHYLKVIKNYTKFPINQFFPSMYDVKINRQPSVRQFFFNDGLKSRFKRALVRNIRFDGMYSFTKYLSNPNGQSDTDFLQSWINDIDESTGYYLEGVNQSNKDENRPNVYLTKETSEKLRKNGILKDKDFRNVNEYEENEIDGYNVRYYDKNQKLIPQLLQILRVGMGTQVAVNYNPLTARILYEHFLNDQEEHILYDPCAGWGGRLLGALSSNRKIHYVGTDVNMNNKGCYENLGNFYNSNCDGKNTFDIYYEGAETIHKNKSFQKVKGQLSLCLTSPPYFYRERYSEDKEQSCIRFPNYQDWLNGFMQPMIKTCYDYLKPNGYLILNVADVKMGEHEYIPLEQNTIEYSVKQGFKYIGSIPMVMSRMIGVKPESIKNNYFCDKTKKIYKTEPTLCFLKEN